MPEGLFVYPATLTNKDWQKKKGLAAKSKKTGIGDTLDALEKALRNSAFAAADPVQLVAKTTDPLAFRTKSAAVTKTLGAASKTVAPKLTAVDQAINKALPVFASGSSQSVRKHLESMRADVKSLNNDLTVALPKRVENAMRDEYRKAMRQTRGYIALKDAAPGAPDVVKALIAQIKQVQQTPDIATVKQLWKNDGPHRKLTTWCKLWDQLVLKDFPEFAKTCYPGKAMTDIFTLPWLEDVANEMNGDASDKLVQRMHDSNEQDAVQAFCHEYSQSVIKARPLVLGMSKAWTVLSQF